MGSPDGLITLAILGTLHKIFSGNEVCDLLMWVQKVNKIRSQKGVSLNIMIKLIFE